MDSERLNWSLVMITHQTTEEDYTQSMEDYYEEDYYDDVENKTVHTHQYPVRIGTSENTAYSCGMYSICSVK